ncbi:MAG: hypothetical protein AB4426_19505 [Xenococcaceae cyanobacterium]
MATQISSEEGIGKLPTPTHTFAYKQLTMGVGWGNGLKESSIFMSQSVTS